MAVSDQDSRGVPMTRTVLLGRLDQPLDFPVGEIFTAALANSYIYEVGAGSRRREFSMETTLPLVSTVTDLTRGVTDPDECSSTAPPDIAGGGTSALWQKRSAANNGGHLITSSAIAESPGGAQA